MKVSAGLARCQCWAREAAGWWWSAPEAENIGGGKSSETTDGSGGMEAQVGLTQVKRAGRRLPGPAAHRSKHMRTEGARFISMKKKLDALPEVPVLEWVTTEAHPPQPGL